MRRVTHALLSLYAHQVTTSPTKSIVQPIVHTQRIDSKMQTDTVQKDLLLLSLPHEILLLILPFLSYQSILCLRLTNHLFHGLIPHSDLIKYRNPARLLLEEEEAARRLSLEQRGSVEQTGSLEQTGSASIDRRQRWQSLIRRLCRQPEKTRGLPPSRTTVDEAEKLACCEYLSRNHVEG